MSFVFCCYWTVFTDTKFYLNYFSRIRCGDSLCWIWLCCIPVVIWHVLQFRWLSGEYRLSGDPLSSGAQTKPLCYRLTKSLQMKPLPMNIKAAFHQPCCGVGSNFVKYITHLKSGTLRIQVVGVGRVLYPLAGSPQVGRWSARPPPGFSQVHSLLTYLQNLSAAGWS